MESAFGKEEQRLGSASLRLWGTGNRSPLGGFCWLEMIDVKRVDFVAVPGKTVPGSFNGQDVEGMVRRPAHLVKMWFELRPTASLHYTFGKLRSLSESLLNL